MKSPIVLLLAVALSSPFAALAATGGEAGLVDIASDAARVHIGEAVAEAVVAVSDGQTVLLRQPPAQ